MMKHTWGTIGAAGALALVAGVIGCASSTKVTPPAPVAAVSQSEAPGSVVDEQVVAVAAIVEKVDQKDRVVTLRNHEGKVFDVKVGADVRNLPQVKKGDEVVVSYYESMALTLRKPGEAKPGLETSETLDRAKAGDKPGGIATQQTTLTATVVGIDKSKGTVTLKGPKGKTVTVAARDKRRLEPVKVGDLIEATYTEAVAISVEKPIK